MSEILLIGFYAFLHSSNSVIFRSLINSDILILASSNELYLLIIIFNDPSLFKSANLMSVFFIVNGTLALLYVV